MGLLELLRELLKRSSTAATMLGALEGAVPTAELEELRVVRGPEGLECVVGVFRSLIDGSTMLYVASVARGREAAERCLGAAARELERGALVFLDDPGSLAALCRLARLDSAVPLLLMYFEGTPPRARAPAGCELVELREDDLERAQELYRHWDEFHARALPWLLKRGKSLGLECGGRLVAACSTWSWGRGFWYLGAFMVHPDYRGRGLGRAFLELVLSRALEEVPLVLLTVDPSNVTALCLYSRVGFEAGPLQVFARASGRAPL